MTVKKAEEKEVKIPEEATTPVIENMEIVSPAEWRKNNYNIRKLQLPTGIVVKVRDVSLSNMASSGILTLPLLTGFLEMKGKIGRVSKKTKSAKDVYSNIDDNDMKAFNEIINKIALKAIIEPKITEADTGEEDSIPIDELEFDDKVFIFQSCIRGGVDSFAGFLGEQ